jgi:hypothetical protein
MKETKYQKKMEGKSMQRTWERNAEEVIKTGKDKWKERRSE